MIRRDIAKFNNVGKKERYAVQSVRSFIQSDKALEGFILVIYGLRRTGKTTILEQALSSFDTKRCDFFEVQEGDNVLDIQTAIIDAQEKGIETICFDEITKASDFITNASVLPDVFAKEGIRIIVTGTDSLSFLFAMDNELYDRVIRIRTTHIPFAEHCSVLETNDMDDYIQFGGLMRKGEPENRIVHDFDSMRKYLDSAVSENIARSLKKNPSDSHLEEFSMTELRTIIEKLVEIYSGTFSTKNMQDDLKKVTINSSVGFLAHIVGKDILHRLTLDSEKIAQDFVKEINADKKLRTRVTTNMVHEFENILIDLDIVSAIPAVDFTYRDGFGLQQKNPRYEYHIIQPAIKFNHLQKGKEFFVNTPYYENLLPVEKTYLQQKLDEKIYGDMLEQIVLYDTSKDLDKVSFEVLKPSFYINGEKKAEFDMLIHDKVKGNYWGVEIKHTTEPFIGQEKHLQNELFFDVLKQNYGNRENVSVLYRGKPFKGTSGTVYLNVSDFLCSIEKTRDVRKTMSELTNDLPIEKIPSEVKENPLEKEIKHKRRIMNFNLSHSGDNIQNESIREVWQKYLPQLAGIVMKIATERSREETFIHEMRKRLREKGYPDADVNQALREGIDGYASSGGAPPLPPR